MSCNEGTGMITKRLTALGTQQRYEIFSPPIQCTGFDELKAVIARTSTTVSGGSTGSLEVRLAAQVAAVRTDKFGAWFNVGTDTYTGDGEDCTGEESVSANTSTSFWIRFGIGYKLTGDRTFGEADVSLMVSYGACGHVVGSRTIQCQTTSSTEVRNEPVTGFFPAIWADKVVAAIAATGSSGQIKGRLSKRTATVSPNSTSGWTLLETDYTAGNNERCTGELTLSNAADMLVQIGYAYLLSSGSALGEQTVTVTVAVRRT